MPHDSGPTLNQLRLETAFFRGTYHRSRQEEGLGIYHPE